jgi:hypothetical protein
MPSACYPNFGGSFNEWYMAVILPRTNKVAALLDKIQNVRHGIRRGLAVLETYFNGIEGFAGGG